MSPMVYFDCQNTSPGSKGAECQKSCQTLDMECVSTSKQPCEKMLISQRSVTTRISLLAPRRWYSARWERIYFWSFQFIFTKNMGAIISHGFQNHTTVIAPLFENLCILETFHLIQKQDNPQCVNSLREHRVLKNALILDHTQIEISVTWLPFQQ